MSSYYHSISSAAAAPSGGDRGHQQQPRHHRQPRPQLARQLELELVRCCRCSLLPADTLPTLILSVLAAAVCGAAAWLARGLHCLAAPRQFGTRQPRTLLCPIPCVHTATVQDTLQPSVVSDAGAGEPGARSQAAVWRRGVVACVTTGGVLARVPRCATTSPQQPAWLGLWAGWWQCCCWLVPASQSGTDCAPAHTTVTTCSDQ